MGSLSPYHLKDIFIFIVLIFSLFGWEFCAYSAFRSPLDVGNYVLLLYGVRTMSLVLCTSLTFGETPWSNLRVRPCEQAHRYAFARLSGSQNLHQNSCAVYFLGVFVKQPYNPSKTDFIAQRFHPPRGFIPSKPFDGFRRVARLAPSGFRVTKSASKFLRRVFFGCFRETTLQPVEDGFHRAAISSTAWIYSVKAI